MAHKGYAIKFKIYKEKEKPYFVAWHPELPGCMADGLTKKLAVKSLNSTRKDYLEALKFRGIEVPEPGPGGSGGDDAGLVNARSCIKSVVQPTR